MFIKILFRISEYMDSLGDMDLFVRVVKNSGLAAAGREVGLSPARMTARMNDLEARYGVRLLHRTTRKITLTEEGQQFYRSCKRVLAEFHEAEHLLQKGKTSFSGSLKITAPSDLGQQIIVPIMNAYSKKHPEVSTYLQLNDGLVRMQEDDFDLAIRYGILKDSNLIAKRLASNHRVLCAAPKYIKKYGLPTSPKDLKNHNCLVMIRSTEPLTTWYFEKNGETITVPIEHARATNDGALVRRWALEGMGICLKSWWDVKVDIEQKKLVNLLEDFHPDFAKQGVQGGADLHMMYPSREFIPQRIREFMNNLMDYFMAHK